MNNLIACIHHNISGRNKVLKYHIRCDLPQNLRVVKMFGEHCKAKTLRECYIAYANYIIDGKITNFD